MADEDNVRSGEVQRKFIRHAYVQRRNAANMQRWIDDFYAVAEGRAGLVEEVEDDLWEDSPELEVTFLSGR